MRTVTIHKAKTNLSQLIEEACGGEEIVDLVLVTNERLFDAFGVRRWW